MSDRKIIQVNEKVPLRMGIPLSIQHTFAMFSASVLVPYILGISPAIALLMNGIGTLLFMLFVNVKITVVVVLLTPISLFVAGFIAKKTYSMFQLQTQTRGEQTALIEEMVGNQKVVQAFCHEKEALGQFADVNDRLQ